MPEPRLSKGYNSRGAFMGRMSHGEPNPKHKIRLYRVTLDSGGYDNGGAYWGLGEPLFRAFQTLEQAFSHGETVRFENESFEFFARAANREQAKREILKRWPNARFYR